MGKIIQKISTLENFRILQIENSKVQDDNELREALKKLTNERIDLQLAFESEKETSVISQKSAIRLKSFSVGTIPDYKYSYIRTKYTNKFILPQTFSSVYLLPTYQKDQRVFIINLSKKKIYNFLASERAKKFKLADLLASLTNFDEYQETQQSQISGIEGPLKEEQDDFIWIPQFSSTSPVLLNQHAVDSFKDYSDSGINAVSYLYPSNLLQLCSLSKIELKYPTKEDNLKIVYQEEDILVDNDFVIGIVNKELLKELNMPVFMTLIDQERFIVSENTKNQGN